MTPLAEMAVKITCRGLFGKTFIVGMKSNVPVVMPIEESKVWERK